MLTPLRKVGRLSALIIVETADSMTEMSAGAGREQSSPHGRRDFT